jgi:hypothetical protein
MGIVAAPETLDWHIQRYLPDVVVCSHLTPILEFRVPTRGIRYPDGALGAVLQVGVRQKTGGAIDLADIISLLSD